MSNSDVYNTLRMFAGIASCFLIVYGVLSEVDGAVWVAVSVLTLFSLIPYTEPKD